MRQLKMDVMPKDAGTPGYSLTVDAVNSEGLCLGFTCYVDEFDARTGEIREADRYFWVYRDGGRRRLVIHDGMDGVSYIHLAEDNNGIRAGWYVGGDNGLGLKPATYLNAEGLVLCNAISAACSMYESGVQPGNGWVN